MSRKTKKELEQENAYLKAELARKNDYIETLEYLHKTDKSRLKAITNARKKELNLIVETANELAPLQAKKQEQAKRARDNAKARKVSTEEDQEIFSKLLKHKNKKEARDFMQQRIKNRTGEKPPRSTIRTIFK